MQMDEGILSNPRMEVTTPVEPVGRGRGTSTNENSRSLSSVLKLPNPFHLRSFVLLFFLSPVIFQIPVFFLLFFRIFEPLGVKRELWEKIQKAGVRFDSRSRVGDRDGSENRVRR